MSSSAPAVPGSGVRPDEHLRQSHGLEQFFAHIEGETQRRVLDLGEFTQSNVATIVSRGHKLYFEDIVRSIDDIFGPGDPATTQQDAAKAAQFRSAVLQYPPQSFDAILVWNTLEYLTQSLLLETVQRLHTLLRPSGLMLVCFRAEGRDNLAVQHSFRIADSRSLHIQPKGHRPPALVFTNRSIEKLFEKFTAVKFFLSRDTVREVIVRK